jgi:myo-inositol-1(or 4)-monophosphatase
MSSPFLETAILAARRAGQEAAGLWRGALSTRFKGPRDLVTDGDTLAERIIVEAIQSRFPDHAILAEEGGLTAGHADAEFLWLIDPIDGTTNYARGLPVFTVSVAVTQAGRSLAGALYDPLRDQMYYAERGAGAFCNGQPLEPSRRTRMIDLLIGHDWPRDDGCRAQVTRLVGLLSPNVGVLRSFGSAALGICLVAAGGFDAYIHPTLQPWDKAAAGLIAEEAGARITTLDGAPEWWVGPTCFASNGLVHELLMPYIRQAMGTEG